ncbi:uncharacterized protein LTR77_005200 [Saxophila tyrrhenica]|uniref:Uncharacterized protein n=1 Tax=Saxophila tyrrhenica TaxID=1690608 RepID=A0AAV9PC70_9PEZI|nr:hypothetical protein LTR77_005200 [Saxophila tyrrhenica]
MAYPTVQAFVHYGSWDDETRSHPAMKWMEDYTKSVVDSKAWQTDTSPLEHHTPDFHLQRSNGTITQGAEAAWSALAEIYGPFAAHKHDPEFLLTFDVEDGWRMIGVANVFFKFAGSDGGAITDPQGEKWDGVSPAAFSFRYVKEGEGIKLKETKIFSDPSPALKLMLQDGALDGEHLVGMLKGA